MGTPGVRVGARAQIAAGDGWPEGIKFSLISSYISWQVQPRLVISVRFTGRRREVSGPPSAVD